MIVGWLYSEEIRKGSQHEGQWKGDDEENLALTGKSKVNFKKKSNGGATS